MIRRTFESPRLLAARGIQPAVLGLINCQYRPTGPPRWPRSASASGAVSGRSGAGTLPSRRPGTIKFHTALRGGPSARCASLQHLPMWPRFRCRGGGREVGIEGCLSGTRWRQACRTSGTAPRAWCRTRRSVATRFLAGEVVAGKPRPPAPGRGNARRSLEAGVLGSQAALGATLTISRTLPACSARGGGSCRRSS